MLDGRRAPVSKSGISGVYKCIVVFFFVDVVDTDT